MDKLNFISEYLSKTNFFRKLADVLLVSCLILVYGFSTGHIKLPEGQAHTVKSSFAMSREIQKVLDVYQNKTGANFVGSFKFNNGQQGLDGFNYIKYTLTEYSSRLGIMVEPEEMQNVPIVVNMPLVGAMVDGKCYSAIPNPNSPKYVLALRMNIQSYTACPIHSRGGNLIGFVSFGNGGTIPPDEAIVREAARQIQLFQK